MSVSAKINFAVGLQPRNFFQWRFIPIKWNNQKKTQHKVTNINNNKTNKKKYPLVYHYLSRHLINSYGGRFSEAYSKRGIPLPAWKDRVKSSRICRRHYCSGDEVDMVVAMKAYVQAVLVAGFREVAPSLLRFLS